MLQEHVDLVDVDAIVLTHSHPDHWLELPVARNALKYLLHRSGLPVYGTAETGSMALRLCGELHPTFRWTTITDAADVEVAGVRMRCSRTDHPVETMAVRLDHQGRSFVFSSDTGSGWSVSQLGSDIGLFLCEASLAAAEEDSVQHLTARQAGAMAADANVARLVLTHLVPGVDPAAQQREAEAAFGRRVELAAPHATYEI